MTTNRQVTTVVTTRLDPIELTRNGDLVSLLFTASDRTQVSESPGINGKLHAAQLSLGELDDLLAPLGYQRQHTVIKYEGADVQAPPSAAAGVEPPAAARSPILDRIAGQVIGPEEALQQLRGAQRAYPQTRRPDAPAS